MLETPRTHAAAQSTWKSTHFERETLEAGSPWVGLDNVTFTSHAAYMTKDAYAELWSRTMFTLCRLK